MLPKSEEWMNTELQSTDRTFRKVPNRSHRVQECKTELKSVPMLLKFPVIRESVTNYIFLLVETLQFVNILSLFPDFTFWLLFDVWETAQINTTTFLKHQM